MKRICTLMLAALLLTASLLPAALAEETVTFAGKFTANKDAEYIDLGKTGCRTCPSSTNCRTCGC